MWWIFINPVFPTWQLCWTDSNTSEQIITVNKADKQERHGLCHVCDICQGQSVPILLWLCQLCSGYFLITPHKWCKKRHDWNKSGNILNVLIIIPSQPHVKLQENPKERGKQICTDSSGCDKQSFEQWDSVMLIINQESLENYFSKTCYNI